MSGVGVTGQEAIIRTFLEGNRDGIYTTWRALDALAALVAERDDWKDRAKGAEHNEGMLASDYAQAVAERDTARKAVDEANDRADQAVAERDAAKRAEWSAVTQLEDERMHREQVVAERDRYRDALDEIEAVVAEPFDGTVLRGLSSVGRAHVQSLARAALAVSTP